MALLILWQIVVTVVVPTQCTPLRKVWDLKGEVQGHCISANAFYHSKFQFPASPRASRLTHYFNQQHPRSTSPWISGSSFSPSK
jgi:hypothetical protein